MEIIFNKIRGTQKVPRGTNYDMANEGSLWTVLLICRKK